MRYFMRLCLLIYILAFGLPVCAAELFQESSKVVSASQEGLIPQAPRVSPDGQRFVFEYYSKDVVSLWIANNDGSNLVCLTCSDPPGAQNKLFTQKLENGSWHPSGKYLVFNRVPESGEKIYVAKLEGDHFTKVNFIVPGSRPQFSKPNGNVIFFQEGPRLSYRILGPDPMTPYESLNVELRGPIAKVNEEVNISHPSLAPDGTTILFAARSGSISKVSVNDIERQRLYGLWLALLKVDVQKINDELQTFKKLVEEGSPYDNKVETLTIEDNPGTWVGQIFSHILSETGFLQSPTLIPGYTKRDLFLLWTFGFLNKLDQRFDQEVQQLIYSRIWVTDVFGAPIEPLVRDMTSAPLPQKWPTISKDGNFAVFEAGHWKNRQIYLIAKKDGRWMDRAIKLTEKGSYNSSPEIDPSGEWLYFESNRDKTKGIWRAKLDWDAINKQLGL